MQSLSWQSIGFYCIFSTFVFYQQLHGRRFKGASQVFRLALNISAFTGMLTGFAYLAYYGWAVVWWAPIVIFLISLLVGVLGDLLERLVGALVISLSGFVGWPVSAYFMFSYVPHST